MSQKKILFIAPHPDDIEFCCGNTQIQLAKKKHSVIMACMTADEYGTNRNDFKGERISRIRRNEMKRAARITNVKLTWLGFIDGYIKITKNNLKYLKNYIEKVAPDVIFAPDPYHPIDFHRDHLRTGYMVLSVLKKCSKRPLTLLYYSFSPDYYVDCRHRKQARQAFVMHRSQNFDSKFFIFFNSIVLLIQGIKSRSSLFAEAYRIVNFSKGLEKKSIINKIKYIIFRSLLQIILPKGDYYKPIPEDLNLKEFRELS